jgi:hypothetical protein
VLVALRTWASEFKQRTVRVWCECGAAAVSILQTSKGSDKILQAIARNIWLSAIYDINLVCEHIPGESNHIADLLSRWHSDRAPVATLYKLLNDEPERYSVDANNLLLDWII